MKTTVVKYLCDECNVPYYAKCGTHFDDIHSTWDKSGNNRGLYCPYCGIRFNKIGTVYQYEFYALGEEVKR